MLSSADQRLRLWKVLYPVGIVLVSLPYLISFGSQLCSDDFILLYYFGRHSPLDIGRFMNPAMIWTWHPLQNWSFSIAWHLSGIEPWGYRIISLGFHLATAFLVMRFVRDLGGPIHLGGVTAILFAGYWRPWEAVAWAASIATLHSTFFAVLVCVSFLRFLKTRRRLYYALMLLAGVCWVFAKETVIQMPLLMAVIYAYHHWVLAKEEEKPQSGEEWLIESARLLTAPVVLVLFYLVFRTYIVTDVYPIGRSGYETAPPLKWLVYVLMWLDRALNPLLYEYPLSPLLQNPLSKALHLGRALKWVAANRLISITAILFAVYFAVRQKRYFPLFALTLALIYAIPYNVLRYGYAVSRYHHGVAVGAAMFAVAIGWEFWRLTIDKRRGIYAQIRIWVAVLGGLWIAASLLMLTHLLLQERDANVPSRAIYDFFASQADKADRPVLFIIEPHAAKAHVEVDLGWGLLECARLATSSDDTYAVELGYDLDWDLVAKYDQIPEKYLIQPVDEDAKIWKSRRLGPDAHILINVDKPRGVELAE